jgi:putative SOS response-associated peptidase YedK
MPVILKTPEEIETWMTAPAEDALKLQQPLPNGTLKIVATGKKDDLARDVAIESYRQFFKRISMRSQLCSGVNPNI